jgi:tRNA pseudouridine32 synthase / 23S rRNA pseudouridine746 synthase
VSVDDWRYDPPPGPLVIVHEDRDTVVIDKPSGLLSVPGRDPAHADSALSRVRARWPGAHDVHRLDLDTSGLLLFATRRKAERALKAAFRERAVQKAYVARVAGHVAEDAGLIDLPLRRETGRPRSVVDMDGGRPARTRFQVRARDDRGTLLDLVPETGRSHQLRVHLLALGHPILGDRFYAPDAVRDAAPRLLLHAVALRFPHPFHGTPVSLRAAAPFG